MICPKCSNELTLLYDRHYVCDHCPERTGYVFVGEPAKGKKMSRYRTRTVDVEVGSVLGGAEQDPGPRRPRPAPMGQVAAP